MTPSRILAAVLATVLVIVSACDRAERGADSETAEAVEPRDEGDSEESGPEEDSAADAEEGGDAEKPGAASPVAPEVEGGPYRQVSLSMSNTCAIDTAGRLQCWNGPDDAEFEGRRFRQVSIDFRDIRLCALDESGGVECWMTSQYSEPIDLPEGEYTDVAAGSTYVCGIDTDGELHCRGVERFDESRVPDGTFRQVEAGGGYACALDVEERLHCWGWLWSEEEFETAQGQAAHFIPPDGQVVQLSSSNDHSCAVDGAGEIRCWGIDEEGETDAPDGPFRQVSAGNYHSCAIDDTGEIQCWGWGREGQVSPPEGTFRTLSNGGYRSCAIDEEGEIHCWGRDAPGP